MPTWAHSATQQHGNIASGPERQLQPIDQSFAHTPQQVMQGQLAFLQNPATANYANIVLQAAQQQYNDAVANGMPTDKPRQISTTLKRWLRRSADRCKP